MRMLREGQAMARITHPNVITVYEVGVEGDLVFLAQELLDAGHARRVARARRAREAEILEKFIAAGRGLAAAHAAGLVHRDFKPDNVLLGKDGRVRVADFGLARALGTDGEDMPAATRANMARARLEEATSPMSPLTRTGAVMGTPMFMAPEQHEGERRRRALRSVRVLRRAVSRAVRRLAVCREDRDRARRCGDRGPAAEAAARPAACPARLRRIVLRGLATKRERTGIRRWTRCSPSSRDRRAAPFRKLAIAIGAGVLVAGAVVGGYVLRSHDEQREQRPDRRPSIRRR